MNKKASAWATFIILVIVVGIFSVLYLFLESKDARLGVMITAIAAAVAGLLVLLFQLTGKASALRKRLEEIGPRLSEEPADSLKEKYLEIYELYLKVSEKEKRNFYAQVADLREKIEEQMKAEKKVEELLGRSHEGSLAERKKNYEAMDALFQQLPRKVQEGYYPRAVQWQEEMEKGK